LRSAPDRYEGLKSSPDFLAVSRGHTFKGGGRKKVRKKEREKNEIMGRKEIPEKIVLSPLQFYFDLCPTA